MTDTESRLLRAILESPGDDTPRLAYADEIEATQPERAEFVRVQCQYPTWFEDDTCLEHSDYRPEYLSALNYLKSDCDSYLSQSLGGKWGPDLGRWVWHRINKNRVRVELHRGFVSIVRAPLAVLVGGECYLCHAGLGDGHPPRNCPACSGTGRVGGIGRDLFGLQPVTRVDTDRLPSTQLINGRIRWAFWREHESGYESLPNITPVSRVPWQLLEYLDAGYESEAAARDALSAALVAHFREQCGLTPLV